MNQNHVRSLINEEFDQYLDIQGDDTQPSKPSNQIESNVEAALAAYAQLVQDSKQSIQHWYWNFRRNKSTKIDEEKGVPNRSKNKATKSLIRQ